MRHLDRYVKQYLKVKFWHSRTDESEVLQRGLVDEKCFNFPVVLDPVQSLNIHILEVLSHPWLLVLVKILLETVELPRDVNSHINIVFLWKIKGIQYPSNKQLYWLQSDGIEIDIYIAKERLAVSQGVIKYSYFNLTGAHCENVFCTTLSTKKDSVKV